MTTLDTLRECHRIVWQYRRELEEVWPTPDRIDALRFCATETAEAIDAELRLNSAYARNRDKDLSVQDELCDALMMALTAVKGDMLPWTLDSLSASWQVDARQASLTLLNLMAAELAHRAGPPATVNPWDVWGLVYAIAEYPGMDLPARLTARLERIKAKRLPQSEAADLDLEYTWLNQAGSL